MCIDGYFVTLHLHDLVCLVSFHKLYKKTNCMLKLSETKNDIGNYQLVIQKLPKNKYLDVRVLTSF